MVWAGFVCAATNGWQTRADAGACAALFAGEGHLPRSRSWWHRPLQQLAWRPHSSPRRMLTSPRGTAITSPRLSAERSLGISSSKRHTHKISSHYLKKHLEMLNGCHSALWNTWIYMERMWIVIYIFEASLWKVHCWVSNVIQNEGKKCKWKGQSREVMSYWGQYNPFKEFNYKRYWALKRVAAIKASSTPFQTSSGWQGMLCAWEQWPRQQEPVPRSQLCHGWMRPSRSIHFSAWICLLVIQ